MRAIREIGNLSLMLALNRGGFSGIWERLKMMVVKPTPTQHSPFFYLPHLAYLCSNYAHAPVWISLSGQCTATADVE
jgi:hypothetical protein